MALPERKTHHLRRGRISIPGASYFITACTDKRTKAFADQNTARRTFDALRSIDDRGDADVIAATIMPDHVHMLFTLGTRLTLGQVLSKFKTFARDQGRASWQWQPDSFEHHLRTVEPIENFGFYIFMNPYRAGLIPLTQRWPWWINSRPERFLFLSSLRADDSIPIEWVEKSKQLRTLLPVR